MPRRAIRLQRTTASDQALLAEGFTVLRQQLDVPGEFSPEVLAAAREATDPHAAARTDRREVPFLTIDPPGSMDLDQAMHLERRGSGYRLLYAIADVPALVTPGGVLDVEARRRVQTLYAPDGRVPLHPAGLSEGAASLLPDQDRCAVLWQVDLGADAEPVDVAVTRALVRSQRRWTYAEVDTVLTAGSEPAEGTLRLLAEVGPMREARERARGAVNLPIPEQEVHEDAAGYRLAYRAPLPVEGWNAQVSLLTGMVAAELMLRGGTGILRTLPEAPPEALVALRRTAAALGVAWPATTSYPELVHSLDHGDPAVMALVQESVTLLRGASYEAFVDDLPEVAHHAGVAAPYAHVTAPLRRLVDRFGLEACLAHHAGRDVPEWVRAALPEVPGLMRRGSSQASAYDRGAVDLVEAVVLRHRVGEVFDAVVVDVSSDGADGVVLLVEPAVRARCDGALPLGRRVRVRLAACDIATRSVRFALVAE